MGLPRIVVIGHAWGVPIRVHLRGIAERALVAVGLCSLLVFGGSQRPLTTSLLLSAAAVALFYAHVLLHELGHLVTARWAGTRVEEVELKPFGGSMAYKGADTPGEMFRVAAGGPLASFLALALTAVLGALLSGDWGFARLSWSGGVRFPDAATAAEPLAAVLVFMTYHVVVALLPRPGSDGGLMAFAYLCRASGDPRLGAHRLEGMRVMRWDRLFFLLVAASAAAVLLGKTGLPALLLGLLVIDWLRNPRDKHRRHDWSRNVESIELGTWLGSTGVLTVAEEQPLTVTMTMTVAEARTRTRDRASDDDDVLIVDPDGRLAGKLSHETLAGAEPQALVADLAEKLEPDDVTSTGATLREVMTPLGVRSGRAIVDADGFLRGVIDGPKLKATIERRFPSITVTVTPTPAGVPAGASA